MSTHYNNVAQTVTSVASSGTGTITLGSAVTGAQSLGTATGGANATVDIFITEGTTKWEVCRNCTYTHSGTTVDRGTLEAGSNGASRETFTSAAVVRVAATADNGRRWDAAALEHVTGPDAATTLGVNTLAVVDLSGWAANRTYTLPATAAVGDRVGMLVQTGSTTRHVAIMAASGGSRTLNGVAGGTEWSRLLIANEVVIMRCVVANTTWIVEQDGRIPCEVTMVAASIQSGIASGAWVTLTQGDTGSWSTPINIGNLADIANNRFVTRRAGNYNVLLNGNMADLAVNANMLLGLQKNGTGNPARAGRLQVSTANGYPQVVGALKAVAAAGDTWRMQVLHTRGSNAATDWISGEVATTLSATEVL